MPAGFMQRRPGDGKPMSRQAPYNPVTSEVAEALRGIVGEKYVVHGDPEQLEAYSHDDTTPIRRRPWCVLERRRRSRRC